MLEQTCRKNRTTRKTINSSAWIADMLFNSGHDMWVADQKEMAMENLNGWWYLMALVAAGVSAAGCLYMLQRRTASVPEPDSNLDDLNRLLQDGSVTPEEYELLKRRRLAGQVA